MMLLTGIGFMTYLPCITALYYINDSQGLGRTFDGIGAISGGGATSKLLQNYPTERREEILDFLFRPKFGASLHILKVEIGGDAQSTEGTESSHMHTPWEESFQRGYEWPLIKEAKLRNKDIRLYGLAWGFPGWVSNGSGTPYVYPQRTANYLVSWVEGAKRVHGVTVDYLGIWNERPYSIDFIKLLRRTLDSRGFPDTQIVAGEGSGWKIAEDVMKDPELSAAVPIISRHYPGTHSSAAASASGKKVWSSEDYSTFDNEVGGGCLARILNQNYVNGNMTRDSLLTANEPWSGHYEVMTPVWAAAHTAQFVQPGWVYLRHGSGVGHLQNGGSYVSLTSPDRKQLTIVIETMSHDMSVCIRPHLKPFKVGTQNITFSMGGSFKNVTVEIWKSVIQKGGNTSTMLMYGGQVTVKKGLIELNNVAPNTIYTLTTTWGFKGIYSTPPRSKPFPLPYTQDFSGLPEYSPPDFLTPQIGSFEVQNLTGHMKGVWGQGQGLSNGRALVQTVLEEPVRWCGGAKNAANSPVAFMGSATWSNTKVATTASIPAVNSSDGLFLAVRAKGGGCATHASTGVFFWVTPSSFLVTYDYARSKVVKQGNVTVKHDTWYSYALSVSGSTAVGSVDGHTLFSFNDKGAPATGYVGLGTMSFGRVFFRNFSIN